MGLRLKYFTGEAVVNLRRNLFMTVAAISTVAVSLFLLGGVIVFGHIVGDVVGDFGSKVQINAFLNQNLSQAETQALQSSIESMPNVAKVTYVDQQQAYKDFLKEFNGEPDITHNVSPSALPASFQISLKNPNLVESVRSELVGRAGIDNVVDGGSAVHKLLQINALLRTVSLVMTLLLLTAATVLIANTIRLAVYARRREISVMKLVGATNWFIRVPFIFEGVVEAVAGACVAAGVIYTAKLLWLDKVSSSILFLPFGVDGQTILKMFIVLVVVGLAVGALGSTLALRRFLEV
ncbi:MAG TPA: permease-like cell division protein FtsX [Actinomycetota bacterium]|nr:permease-like cell division protein FtsX [Actinomycetota bacterium]